MKKLFSIFSLLLLCSTATLADEEKVIIDDNIDNGSVSYTIDDATVSLTVTPSEGYYIKNIAAAKTINVSSISSTRADGPALGVYTVTRASESNDLSEQATYTFKLDEGLGAYVTAEFAARTEITDDMLTLSAASYVYDGSNHVPEVSVGSLTNGTHYTVNAQKTAINVGSYNLTVTGISIYKGELTATWSITQRGLTITAENKTKVVGHADPELTYTVEGLVEGDALTGALTRAAGEEVGEYDITQGTLAASDNYSVSFTGAKFTIVEPEPNGKLVNTDNPVDEEGEKFYGLNEETKEATKGSIDTDIALTPGASDQMQLGEDGTMTFPQGNNTDFLLMNQKQGNHVKFEFTGSMSVSDTKMKEVAAGARGTRAGGMLKLVSGHEYEVLEDGNIVITIELTEAPATLNSIHAEAPTTGIEEVKSGEVKSEKWYNLSGHRLKGKPVSKGVYINNGKKVVLQ